MSVRVAKNRIELRIDGKTFVVMPGKSYDFSAEDEATLDNMDALQPVEKIEQVKPEVEDKPKRGRKKAEVEATEDVADLDA